MALIIRIDVDRPYGKRPVLRHVLSRVGSDAYLPRVEAFGYLKKLNLMPRMLNEKKARANVAAVLNKHRSHMPASLVRE